MANEPRISALQSIQKFTQETANGLATEAYAYLKEAESVYKKYNEVVGDLHELGYYQAPQIISNPLVYSKSEDFHHNVFFSCEDGGFGYTAAEMIINAVLEGPVPMAEHLSPPPSRKRSQQVSPERSFPSPKSSEKNKLRIKIGEASGWICVYCQIKGTTEKGPDGRSWHIDHMYPMVDGGDSRSDNLILSCATCNLKKNRHLASEILKAAKAKMEAGNATA